MKRFSNEKTPKVPEILRQDSGIMSLGRYEVELPSFTPAQLLNHLEPAWQETISKLRVQFDRAHTVIAITGTYGLGDGIMELRYIFHLARQTNKQIVCQVNPGLLPLLQAWQSKIPNISFVEKCSPNLLKRDDTFFLMANHSRTISGWYSRWIDLELKPKTAEQTELRIEELYRQNRVLDSGIKVNGQQSHYYSVVYSLPRSDTANTTDLTLATQLLMLGIPIKAKDITQNSIIPLNTEQIRQIPQNLDYLIAPDAREIPVEDKSRSSKSLSADGWAHIIKLLPPNSRVGIIKGVSHPAFSQNVIESVEQAGVAVEVIEGDLLHVATQMLRAKTFVGMDSGTTHLALDVVRAAKSAGRQINLKEIMKGHGNFFPQYAVTGVPILGAQLNGAADLGKLNQKQLDYVAHYIMGPV